MEAENLVGSHYVSVLMGLPDLPRRALSGTSFADAWRQRVGDIQGAEAVSFTGEANVTGGETIQFDLFHPDANMSAMAASRLGSMLSGLSGVTSVSDGQRTGKPEFRVTPNEVAPRLSLTAGSIGEQIRDRFYGAEAIRIARDGNDVRVMVRLSEDERQSIASVQSMLLKTPDGALLPLQAVASFELGQSQTSLHRRDGKRIYSVTADIVGGADEGSIEDTIEDLFLPALQQEYPGIVISLGGEDEEISESLSALGVGFLYALGGIFFILILYFNSIRHPLVVLSVIPFSVIGAIWAHIALGYDLSIVSIIGIIAVSGVVVNDSVVFLSAYREHRQAGCAHKRAIIEAACERLRPILLTSLTTFFGLLPMMMETSEQAQFLIPMAVSISFGLLAATVIVLFFVPAVLGLVGEYKSERSNMRLAMGSPGIWLEKGR